MSFKAERQYSSELDHIRDTLTNVVGVVGETRREVHALGLKVDANQRVLEELVQKHDVLAHKHDVLAHKHDILAQKYDSLAQKVDSNQQENRQRFDRLEMLICKLLPDSEH